jgi:hypothetical protein
MLSGLLAKLRGCRCGIPDVLLIFRRTASPRCPTHICFLELKSKRGRLSPAQKVVRSELLAVGATWFLARSANAALTALYCSGVPFRRPWKPSRPLARWEGPFAHVTRLPQHPVVAAERREEKQRYRLRKEIREKEAARLAAARDGAGLIDARAHRRVG